MGADADIIMAIHEQRKRLPFPVSFKHVYGHQDEKAKGKGKKNKDKDKKKPKLDPTECPPLDIDEGLKSQFGLGATPTAPTEEEPEQNLQSTEVQINITCDELATETAKAVIDGGEALTLPYAGSKAMLRIGDRWVTSHHKKEIHRARHEPALRAYCLEKFKKYNWNDEVFDLVSWSSVGSVRRKYGQTKRMFTSKTMYGWLPIGHMHHRITNVNQCPGCRHDNETMEHLFPCMHRTCVTTRTKTTKELAR